MFLNVLLTLKTRGRRAQQHMCSTGPIRTISRMMAVVSVVEVFSGAEDGLELGWLGFGAGVEERMERRSKQWEVEWGPRRSR